jgi:hypothetical protein
MLWRKKAFLGRCGFWVDRLGRKQKSSVPYLFISVGKYWGQKILGGKLLWAKLNGGQTLHLNLFTSHHSHTLR